MKTPLLLVLFAASLTGCASLEKQMDKAIPDGSAKSISGTITGKFSSTQFEGKNFVKTPEKVTADSLHLRHTNIYVPLIDVEFTGYERVRKP